MFSRLFLLHHTFFLSYRFNRKFWYNCFTRECVLVVKERSEWEREKKMREKYPYQSSCFFFSLKSSLSQAFGSSSRFLICEFFQCSQLSHRLFSHAIFTYHNNKVKRKSFPRSQISVRKMLWTWKHFTFIARNFSL